MPTFDDLEGGNTSADKVVMVRDPSEHVEGPQTVDNPGEFIFDDATGAWIFEDDLGQFDPRTGGGISIAQHKALRDIIHFIDDGPGDGFASGAYKETLPAGDPFPTSIIWWESSSKLKKIVEKTIERVAGPATNVAPTPVVWKLYDTDGTTVLVTVSDAIAYSGVFETSRTRTIS